MTIYLPSLDLHDKTTFPSVESAFAEPDGLLAMGGDLSPERLLAAYRQGIFPWFSDPEPYLWWSPSQRAVLDPHTFKPSRSLKKSLRKHHYAVSLNRCFEKIIEQCALTRPKNETWVTLEMRNAYTALHRRGQAHSVEVWENNELVGGLYGVSIGGVFCGESMFSLKTDASKTALWFFCAHFRQHGGQLIDCQMMTPHLQSMGAQPLPREGFIAKIQTLKNLSMPPSLFAQQWIHIDNE